MSMSKKMKKSICTAIAFSLLFSLGTPLYSSHIYASNIPLATSGYTFNILDLGNNQYGISILSGSTVLYDNPNPLKISIKINETTEAIFTGKYSSCTSQADGSKVCTGSVTTANGSVFNFTDTYNIQSYNDNGISMSRTVSVANANANDKGFNSLYTLSADLSSNARDYDYFAPGVWYKQNDAAPSGAIGQNLDAGTYFYIKETRLASPLFMIQHKSTGQNLTFGHIGTSGGAPSVSSGVTDERTSDWLVNNSIQYGSIGFSKNNGQPVMSFVYPGSEGERSYWGGGVVPQGSSNWARRAHAVTVGFSHSYSLIIRMASNNAYSDAMSKSFQYFNGLYNPQPVSINQQSLYSGLVATLKSTFTQQTTGYNNNIGRGWPFQISLPYGPVDNDTHLQGGFVGQQTTTAYALYREGLKNNDADAKTKGTAALDFWANNSLSAAGVPKQDYWYFRDGNGAWDQEVFLRTFCECAEGVLNAYIVSDKYGESKSNWLSYCTSVGNFLLSKQNADGSWARSYAWRAKIHSWEKDTDENGNAHTYIDGEVIQSSKLNTASAVNFLVRLYQATGNTTYLNAAYNAGEYVYNNITLTDNYIGGTPDNSNVIDKEAGLMALKAFLALYEAKGTAQYLTAAAKAADYAQTWTYNWSYNTGNDPTSWIANSPYYEYPRTKTDDQYPYTAQWLKIDLGSNYSINQIMTYPLIPSYNAGRVRVKFKVEYSRTGTSWTTFADHSTDTTSEYGKGIYNDIKTSAVTARYIRVSLPYKNDLSNFVEESWLRNPGLKEVKVFSNGTNVAINKTVTASSNYQNRLANNAVDNDALTSPQANSPFPNCGLLGQSLVATGHSYIDMFMTFFAPEYDKLYTLTSNIGYYNFSQILRNNTNSPSNLNSSLAYPYAGIIEEGGGSIPEFKRTGQGVNLNWCTAVQLDQIIDFEDLDHSDWTLYPQSNWAKKSEKSITASTQNAGWLSSNAIKTNALSDNYTLSADVTLLERYVNECKYGLYPWYKDSNNYVVFWFDLWQGATPQITATGMLNGNIVGNSWRIGSLSTGFDGTVSHNIAIKRVGARFICYVDNAPILDETFSEITTAGNVGLNAFNAKADYTNISITDFSQWQLSAPDLWLNKPDNVVIGNGGGTSFLAANAFYPSPNTTTYDVSVKMKMLSSTGNERKEGLYPWYKDANNWVIVWLDHWVGGNVALTAYGRINGINTSYMTSELPASFSLYDEHLVTVDKTENRFVLKVDGIQYNDIMLTGVSGNGMIGLNVFGMKAQFTGLQYSGYY